MVLLVGMVLASTGHAADQEVSLPEAVRQAIASNLDLAARRRALAAARQEIGLARSALLPQVDVGAQAEVFGRDSSEATRDDPRQESVAVGAGLGQVLYDENAWAGFEIQKHVYDGQVQQLEAFQLGVIQDAANAFLELDRSQRVLEIQQRNREITRQNLGTSRSRIAAGWSSDREVLRWEAQLAENDTEVRTAQVLVLQNRFALNRVRNLPPEAPFAGAPATIEDYGFAYAREAIADAIVAPEQDRRMRNFLVRVGLRRSPDLAALDASIAAAERQLVASRRAFWVPSLTLDASIDHLENYDSPDDFDETTWGVRGALSFPLFSGGAKFAGLEQAREALATSRTDRRATAELLEQSIRSSFARASGSFESVGFADRQVAAARRNFELVDRSYTLGVASILDLLDAQEQLLTAELTLANAVTGFLVDLVAAEREISFYGFLEAPAEVEAMLNELAREVGVQP